MASESQTAEAVEASPLTKNRAATAVQRLLQMLEQKVGEKGFYGEVSVRVRFQDGQINHLTADCSEVLK